MEQIVTCDCNDIDQFVKDAFTLISKDRPMPPIRHISTVPNEGMIIHALQKAPEKFAYYFHGDEIWDLLKGVRVA